jgi:hypothetical protein
MATIVTRAGKGSALTHTEMDANFTNLNTELAAAGGGPTITATASGTLANGDTVCLNSNGTVSAITGSEVDQAVGSETTMSTSAAQMYASIFDPVNNKVVVFYRDSSLNLKGVVGTVSGTSISFGTQQNIASRAEEVACSYDTSQSKILLVYRGISPYYGKAHAVTVSGTSLSVGSAHTFNADETLYMDVAYDATAGKHVVAYADNFTNQQCQTLTMSGTSISSGSQTQLSTAHSNGIAVCYDAGAQKTVIANNNGAAANQAAVRVASISGTSITLGTPDYMGIYNHLWQSSVYDPDNGGCLFAYYDTGESSKGRIVRVTVSGTTATLGNPFIWEDTNNTQTMHLAYDEDSNQILIAGKNSGSVNLYVLTANGDNFTNPTGGKEDLGTSNQCFLVYDTNANKAVINYISAGKVITVGYANSNITTENFLGFSDGAYSNGATATIQVVGSVDDAQSGLTTGRKYYVHADGSLKTYTSIYLPDAYAGLATSSTKILVKG